MSNFEFLISEWKDVHEAAAKAEETAIPDPRTSCFYARRALELAVAWAYKFDRALKLPYQDNISALIHEPTFKQTAGDAVFTKAKVLVTLGNRAVHSHRDIPQADSVQAVKELFHFCYWFARLYARRNRPDPRLAFDQTALPTTLIPKQTLDQLKRLEAQLQEKDEKLSVVLADKDKLDEQIKQLRKEVAQAKKTASTLPDDHNYSEAETRDYFIDLLLKEAGWPLDQKRDREFPVAGMPNYKGDGFVDYVLWGDDGKPLALVEAKRSRRDPKAGEQQARLYADCLEAMLDQRPIIFYSNGYEHWVWDDQAYPPRRVQGFFKKAELELLIQRRSTRRKLASATINDAIVERYYQTRAIRRIGESFETDRERKALLVMATGSGKTRTVIALCDMLIRCNWVKRVLFLADRVALVNQTTNVFKKFLPDASAVNLITEKDSEGRVFVSTYPTMMGLIDDAKDGQRRFGVGHFDLVVIDEAHRSVFQKYRAIFDYFDSLLVGLTATPKDEIDKNTYGLFDLETGVPTDAYDLDEAVADKFLVPPKAVSVPLKFEREGIKYNDLSEGDKDEWDAKEWDDEGNIPDKVEAAAINKWLFNMDTVDKDKRLASQGNERAGQVIEQTARYDRDFDPETEPQVSQMTKRLLCTHVASMKVDNFVVRAHRRSVEKFARLEAWNDLTDHDHQELTQEVAGLPTQMERESEEAKRFDLLLLNLQLALLKSEPAYERLRDQVIAIAGLLEEKSSIPMVDKQMTYIQDVQTEPWWKDVTVPMLEVIRRRLRDLVQFIEKEKRKPVYTDFEDLLGDEVEIELETFSSTDTFERFRDKAQAFLREHLDIEAVRKLRTSEPLTGGDLDELERVFNDNKIGNEEFIRQATRECQGFGIFVRSLVGLERDVAKMLFGEFLQGGEFNANQIEFVNLIINQLVDHGIVDVSLLYESPFTDVSPQGPDALFTAEQIDKIMKLLDDIRSTALAV